MMINVILFACVDCKNAYKDGDKICCGAFPEGVPRPILDNKTDPRKMPECGNGFKFEDKRKMNND